MLCHMSPFIDICPYRTSIFRRTQTTASCKDSRSQAMLLTAIGGTAALFEAKGAPTFPPEVASPEDLRLKRLLKEEAVMMPHAIRVMEAL